jgi:thioesterase domain-containing protein
MSKLSKLYEAQQTLKENGLSFSEEQEAQLRALEEEIIKNDILPVLTEQIEPALKQVQRELVLVVDYVPGEDLKVHLSRKRNIADALTDAVEISPKRTVNRTATDVTRSHSVGFTVHFEDGTTISHGNAKQTFIEALQHMSLSRVSTFTGRTFADFPLVGKKRRVTEDGYKWQEQVDGWWIYVNMSNDTKMSMLRQVAKHLNISLDIIVDGRPIS